MKKRLFLTIPLLLTLTGCGVIKRILPRPSENESSLEESSESSEEILSSETTSTVLSSEQESEPLESSEETPSEELSESSIEESSEEEPELSSEEDESSMTQSSENVSSYNSSEYESSDYYSSDNYSSDYYSSGNDSSDFYSSGNYSSDNYSSDGSSENYSSGGSSHTTSHSSQPFDSYYSDVEGSNAVSAGYCSLLNSINSTISKNTKNLGYSGLWTAYKTTDVRDDGYLYDVYSNMTKFKLGNDQCGSYGSIGDCYNREHTIPQSWWGSGTSGQGCDVYIVIPSDGKINGVRGNYPYGETTTGTSYKLTGDPDGNRLGTSTSASYVTGTVFEPFDDRKGDLARIVFYAVARYLKSGSANGAIKNWTSDYGNRVFGSGSDCTNFIKTNYLQMLLKWHKEDPVSAWEMKRNDNGQSVQNNRNPFVDHPSWVDIIWGGEYGADLPYGEETYGGTASVSGGLIN